MPEHQLNPEIITTTPESEPNSVPPEIVQLLNLLDLQEKLVYWNRHNIHDLALVLETDEDSPRLKKDEAKAIAERTEELTTAIEATLATLTTAIAVSIQSEEMQKTWQTLIPGEHFATPDEAQHFAQELLGSFYIQYTRRLRKLSSSVNHDDKTVDPINAEEQAIDVAWELTGVAQPIESTGDPATLAEKRATQAEAWDELIQTLSVLPGPHHPALQAYLKDTNATSARALVLSYKKFTNIDKNQRRILEMRHTVEDLAGLESLLATITTETKGIIIPSDFELVDGLPMTEARRIFDKDFFGPQEIRAVFGFELPADKIPGITYTKEQLEQAKAEGMMLVLFVDTDAQGNSLSAQRMRELTEPLYASAPDKGKLLHDTSWYKDEAFYTTENPERRWRLVSKEPLPNTTSKTYANQTKELRTYLQTKNALTAEELAECSDAVLDELNRLAQSNETWQTAAERLVNLKINQNHRLSFVETIQVILHARHNGNTSILESIYSWTKSSSFYGNLVNVGNNERYLLKYLDKLAQSL